MSISDPTSEISAEDLPRGWWQGSLQEALINAALLKEALTNADLYDPREKNPARGLAILIADIMNLIDVEKYGRSDLVLDQARKYYTKSVGA